MDEVERIAHERKPEADPRRLERLPALPGLRALPRDRRRRRRATSWSTWRTSPGLVAAGEHPNPVPYADVVTSTVHKTLGGARGGLILCREEYAKADQLGRLPGPAGRPARARHRGQGGRLPHRADRALPRAPAAHGRRRQGAGRGAAAAPAGGVNVLTGGTDVHLVLVDLRESELDGQQAEDRLHEIGITVNRNAVPFDPRPPMVTSGLRVGASALATRGLQVEDFHEVGRIIAAALSDGLRGRQGRAGRARRGDRRPLPALRAPRCAGRCGVAQPPRPVGSSVDDRGRRGLRLPRLPSPSRRC